MGVRAFLTDPKGKEFSKPTVSQIKRYARKKQRDLEGDE